MFLSLSKYIVLILILRINKIYREGQLYLIINFIFNKYN